VGDVDGVTAGQTDPGLTRTRRHKLWPFTDHGRNFSDCFLYIHVNNIESRCQTGHHGALWYLKAGHET
jgi:hypothetical protein